MNGGLMDFGTGMIVALLIALSVVIWELTRRNIRKAKQLKQVSQVMSNYKETAPKDMQERIQLVLRGYFL
jgi:hypothetical protein